MFLKTSEINFILSQLGDLCSSIFRWVYSHTKETLHTLLERELSEVAGVPLGFEDCYGGK